MATYHLSHAATNTVLKWLLNKRNPEAEQDATTGRLLLSYSRPYRLMILTFAVFSSLILVFGVFVFRDELRPLIIVSLIFGLLWVEMLFAVYDTFLVRLSFTEEAIFREGRFGGTIVVPWSSITAVSYSAIWNWFKLQAESFPTIRVSIYRNGLGTLAQYAGRGLERSPAGSTPLLLHQLAVNPAAKN